MYKLPDMFCLIVFSLRKLVQNWFDYLVYWLISRKLTELTTPMHIARYIRLFKELIFDDEQIKRVPVDVIRDSTCETINKYIYEEIKMNKLTKFPLVSSESIKNKVERGTRLCVESFQYPILNKKVRYRLLHNKNFIPFLNYVILLQLTYYLLDALVQELIPELVKK